MAKFQPIDEGLFARQSARAAKSIAPVATSVQFDRRTRKVRLTLSTGIDLTFDPRAAHGLEHASDDELASVRIEGVGGAIHFASLDSDFSVARLLEGFLGPIGWARREARAAASRRNGKLGGRPRKLASSAAS